MSLGKYLSENLARILGSVFALGSLCVFLYFTGTGVGEIAIISLVWLSVLAINVIAGWLRCRAILRELDSIMDNLDKKYLFSECVPRPWGEYEKKLFSLMRRSGKSMIEEVSEAQSREKEYKEFIESWVHEIKAPITTAKLQCANSKSELSEKLLPQLTEIEAHVERVLYYARAGSVEKDFVIKKVSLLDIVTAVLGRLKPLLIQNTVSVELGNLDFQVYSDGKWLDFMLGQFLQNSVRYSKDSPLIKIFASQEDNFITLGIEDNGIGIAQQDLPRVFQRGFTGANGRVRGGSTGMGLYICKLLSEPLQVELGAESVEGEFTRLNLVFRAIEKLN